MSLPSPPTSVLDEQGEGRFGRYEGPLGEVDLSRAEDRVGPGASVFKKKKWFYVALATDELYVGCAIVDAGYVANAFVFAASPKTGLLAASSHLGLARLGCRVSSTAEEGAEAWLRTLGATFRLKRDGGAYDLAVDTAALRVRAMLDTTGAPAPITAICRPPGGDVNVTTKRALLPASGHVVVQGAARSLAGALGGLDYTHGLLPRITRWRWAFFMGKTSEGERVAMNLVEGFNGEPECVVWIGDELVPVGEGRFQFDAKTPLEPWQVRTTCGAVDLRFSPVGMHAEKRALGLIRSEFVQPVGVFHGTLRVEGRLPIELVGVPGVVEDQSVKW